MVSIQRYLDTLEAPEFESGDEEVVVKSEKVKKGKKGKKGRDSADKDEEAAKLDKGFKFETEESKVISDWNFIVDDELKKKVNKRVEEAVQEEAESEDEDEDDEDEEEEEEKEETIAMEMPDRGGDVPDPEEDSAQAIADFFDEDKQVNTAKTNVSFAKLQLSRPILKALGELNYVNPTPIQKESIPIALLGKDIVAGAETGSGKTAAYMIPILERLLFKPSKVNKTRVVVLTPTRELSIQVFDVGKKLGKYANSITYGMAVGGLNLRKQEQELKSKPDIVIATPGRFIDHIRNSPSFNVDSLEVLVVDEADRMLEEGFQQELTEILSLIPQKRQTLLFSATMNSKIATLIQMGLNKPVRIMVDSPNKAAAKLTQEFVRIRAREALKPALLYNILTTIDSKQQRRIVVFVSRKEMAHKLKLVLKVLGINAGELHGALSQEQRLISVTNFKNLSVPVLICTDLAARGLDIPKIEFVINYDMPKSYDIYVHRVGRTARANREGQSISLVGERNIERAIVKQALKNIEADKGAISRQVNWPEVEKVNKKIEENKAALDELVEQEQQQKEIEIAEREIKKGENFLKYKTDILARPKRTWFEKESDKTENKDKRKKLVNRKQRKRIEEGNRSVSFGKLKK